MLRRVSSAIVPAAVWLAAVCLLASCSSSDPLGQEIRSLRSIVVGSGDFPESQIMAEIYAQALQANGFDVGRRLGIGSRETYIPALKDHSVDLVPEYIGNLLQYFEPKSTATMLDAVELELYKRLPGDLSVLTPSAGIRHGHRHRHRSNRRGMALENHRRLGRTFVRRQVWCALGLSGPPIGAARPEAEIRTDHQSG